MPMMPSGAALRGDLADFLVQHYRDPNGYIAEQVMPFYDVADEQNTFKKLSVNATAALPDDTMSVKGGANSEDWELEEDSYATKPRGFDGRLHDLDRARMEQAGQDGEAVVAMRTADILMARQEYRVAQIIYNTTNFPLSGTTGVSVSNAWSSSSGTPLADVATGMRVLHDKVGGLPNTLVIHLKTYLDLCNQDRIKERYLSVAERGQLIPLPALAAYFGVAKLLVAGLNTYNTADKGLTASLSGLWGTGYAWLGYTANGDNTPLYPTPQVGRIFSWNKWGGRLRVKQVRDDVRETDIFQVRRQTQEKFFGNRYGYLMGGV